MSWIISYVRRYWTVQRKQTENRLGFGNVENASDLATANFRDLVELWGDEEIAQTEVF